MKLRIAAAITLLTALACGGGGASDEPILEEFPVDAPEPAASACPEGVNVAQFWPGEYPSPVVQVTEKLTLMGRAHACGPLERKCTVAPGLYHPWSVDDPALGYVSVSAVERWKAVQDTELSDDEGQPIPVDAGAIIIMESYLAEGYCSLRAGELVFSDECPQPPAFEQLPSADYPGEQLILAACVEGYEALLPVADLLSKPEVQEGQILGWGEVGPAE